MLCYPICTEVINPNIRGEAADFSGFVGLGWVFLFSLEKSDGIMVVYKFSRIRVLVLLQQVQTQLWNEKSISKPHISRAMKEDTIPILHTISLLLFSSLETNNFKKAEKSSEGDMIIFIYIRMSAK